MIDYIKGEIAELSPASVTIECAGIGYQANISLNTYSALNGTNSAKIYIYESIRDDAHVLFGFADKGERQLFLHLISVSGVGPSTARVILSSMNFTEIESAIATENVAILQSIKGIGPKTAQRIIVDLKDKIILSEAQEKAVGSTIVSDNSPAAVSALVMLGFSQSASTKTVSKIVKESPTLSVEAIIKEALKRM